MKCITICQPHADLLLLPESDPRFKRTENRKWRRDYIGPLLVHAGKSRSWLKPMDDDSGRDVYGFPIAGLLFGAILGIVDVIDWCQPDDVAKRHPHLKGHQHITGPWCMVIENPRRFSTPVPCEGSLSIWDVDGDKLTALMLGADLPLLRGLPCARTA